MTLPTETGAQPPGAVRRSINVIAAELAHDEWTRMDLRQEMFVHFLKLPAGKPASYYERSLRNCASVHRKRSIIDAPLDGAGNPILARQTVCVGGLAELDRLAAAQFRTARGRRKHAAS